MAWLDKRNKAAKRASQAINPIAKTIMKEWKLKFEEIQEQGIEPKFDREIIKRIYENEEVKRIFLMSMTYTAENYGKIWYEFSSEQWNIIALKDTKIFW